jgi:hypothetical protein
MATLVLTAVGTLVGGPLGGAIGALVGNQIDRGLFSPKAAHGARLDSLAVQASSYGTDLPRLFGTMRVSGSVIWATDLKEDKHRSGGGKGSAKTTSYSYSSSFAVALSARPIRAVHRIWADGTLLRGAAGDWKGDLGAFRLHLGDEAQAADPLIAAAEGIEATPAHRGIAYAVFEDLQLADYGNRIPSLSFEVEADEEPLSVGAIADMLSDGAVTGAGGGPALLGYAASGDSLRGAIEGLAAALPVAFAEGPDGVRLVDETAAPAPILAAELGTATDGAKDRPARLALDRRAAGTLNEAIAISYYDPARDYQTGSQVARRDMSARRAGTIELAAAVEAGTARGIAEARLAREWAGRTSATVTLPWRRLDLGPGALVTLPGEAGVWRVTERVFEAMGVTLTATRLPGPDGPPPAASPGRSVAQPDEPHGPTTLAAMDLPPLGDTLATAPVLAIAAAGVSPGWRRATLLGSLDGGASWTTIGQTAAPAVIGRTLAPLPAGSAMLVDQRTSIEVELLNDTMALAGSDQAGAASATANLALIGDELIQFGRAEQIEPLRFRLSALLRGRRGTEWAIGGHAAGELFVLIEADSLVTWQLPAGALGGRALVAASGIGDAAPVQTGLTVLGRALRPPAPVSYVAELLPNRSIACRWTRRSRAGWPWLDGTDAPLVEETERYRLTVSRAGGTPLTVEIAAPEALLSADQIAAIGGIGPLTIELAQIGTFAPSLPPAVLTVPLGA